MAADSWETETETEGKNCRSW